MTEYSSMAFALFFLGEYANMIMMSGSGARFCFWGAGLSPVPYIAPFTWIPGVVWFALKVSFLSIRVHLWCKRNASRAIATTN